MEVPHSDTSSVDSSAINKASQSSAKWVRFDDTVSVETTLSDPSTSSNTSANGIAKQTPRGIPSTHKSTPLTDVAQIEVEIVESRRPFTFFGQNLVNKKPPAEEKIVKKTRSNTSLENGQILCEIDPQNRSCPWLTAPTFDPYKMPKALIADKLPLPVEDFVRAMEVLTNDFRFRLYTVCYRRLIITWMIVACLALIGILSSGLQGMVIFAVVLVWLFVLGLGVVGCLFGKQYISTGLQQTVSCANRLLMPLNLLLGVEDRGKISCHKIGIPFVYFNVQDCLPKIAQQIMTEDQTRADRGKGPRRIQVDPSLRLDESATTFDRAQLLALRYSQAYVKALVRGTVKFPSRPIEGVSEFTPLHCRLHYCLCQYVQQFHFEKQPGRCQNCFGPRPGGDTFDPQIPPGHV